MAASIYNVFVGSETGLLKGIDVNKAKWDNLNSLETIDRDNEICALCWDGPEDNLVCYGLRNRKINTYDPEHNSHGEATTLEGGTGVIKGIARINDNYITAVQSGLVKIWNEDNVVSEIEAGDKLCCMIQNPQNKSLIATGGDENELKIWNVNEPKAPVFVAKNVRNDWLNLRVRVKVLGVQFVPNSEEIVTCTGYSHVRLYDPRTSQRRPMVEMTFDEYPLMSMGISYTQPHQVVVGNTQGKTALLDFRKGKTVHCFRGFAGSVRHIQCHPTLPLFASCGLDRFLRIHHLESRKLLYKFYLKSRLNCFLMSKNWTRLDGLDEGIEMNEEEEEEEEKVEHEEKEGEAEVVKKDGEEEDDDVWNELENMSAKAKKVKAKKADESKKITNKRKNKAGKQSKDEVVKTESVTAKKRKKSKKPS